MILVPLKDDNPTRSFAALTAIFVAINAAVFIHQATLEPAASEEFILRFGMIPGVLTGAAYIDEALNPPPAWTTVFSAMFLHGSLMHVAGNMLYLWTFGNNVEDSMGRFRFLVFYALCGLAAAVAQGAADPSSTTPMIGASGAVSGVLGAYLLLHPHAQVWSFAFFRFAWLPAWAVLGFWIVVQFANAFLADSEQGGVAWWAHVGGFLAGIALIPIFKRRGVKLFEGRNRTGPWG